MHWQRQNQWAVREGKWKLIVNGRDTIGKYSPHRQRPRRMESPFLGNFADDQPEWKNYAAKRPGVVERLTELHNVWVADVGLTAK